MKVLILENVTSLDTEILEYVKVEHQNDTVKAIFNILNVNKEAEILEDLKICDCLLMQSTFSNSEQLEKFLDILPNFKNIKEIRIIYTYTAEGDTRRFLKFIEHSDLKPKIINLLNHTAIKEVVVALTELPSEPDKYFKTFKVNYDIVPLYYNHKHDVVWHEFRPILNKGVNFMYLRSNPNDVVVKTKQEIIKSKTLNTNNKIDDSIHFSISKEDSVGFNNMLKELRAVINMQIESCHDHDFGDSKTLIEEKESWLQILNKLKKIKK